jgi:hypothetical protein
MKKILQLPLLVAICALLSVTGTQAAVVLEQNSQMEQLLDGDQPDMTLEQFVQLSPKQIEEMTGQKMGFKETLALKKAQKQIKKSMKDGSASNPKSQIIALILVIFVGTIGIHRFYLGYTTIGILQILTLGGCGIWTLIDLIRIITGDLGPADGSAYDPAL